MSVVTFNEGKLGALFTHSFYSHTIFPSNIFCCEASFQEEQKDLLDLTCECLYENGNVVVVARLQPNQIRMLVSPTCNTFTTSACECEVIVKSNPGGLADAKVTFCRLPLAHCELLMCHPELCVCRRDTPSQVALGLCQRAAARRLFQGVHGRYGRSPAPVYLWGTR